MSKDFDVPNCPPQWPSPHAERRRSARWNGHVPVFVYGHTAGGAPFYEEGYSTVVNDRGALLIVTTPVPPGEKLLLINKVTQLEQVCRVVHVGRHEAPSVEIAVEFAEPDRQFWQVAPGPHRSPTAEVIETRRTAR